MPSARPPERPSPTAPGGCGPGPTPRPASRRNIERFAQFLTLIGLTALVVGGVGVANAVSSYLDGKREVIATFKCLGARASFPVAVYLIEIMLIAALGIAAGLVLGAIIPFVAGSLLSAVVPVAIAGVYPAELALAAVFGFLTALAFALYPLGRAREVSATALFRDQVAPSHKRPPLAYIAAVALALAALAGARHRPRLRAADRRGLRRRDGRGVPPPPRRRHGRHGAGAARAAGPLHRASGSRSATSTAPAR